MRNSRIVVSSMCIVLFAHGCTTSLDVCKLEDPGGCPSVSSFSTERKAGKVIGVPYHLTKTEFLLSVEPPSEKAPLTTYTVNQVNTPDLKHRYWVNIDPAWLTKTNFKLTFGSKGELTSTSFNAAEQVTPTIKAVGEFALAAISAAAGVAGKMGGVGFVVPAEEDPPSALLKTVTNLPKINNPPDCKSNPQVPTDPQKSDRTAMLTRLQEAIDLNSTKQFHKLFAYRSATEKCWLQSADIMLKGQIEKERSAEYKKAVKDYEDLDSNVNRKSRITKGLEKWLQSGTKEDLESFSDFARSLVKQESSIPHTEAADRLIALAGEEFKTVELWRKQRALIGEIIKLDIGAWRDRYATFLEESIQQEERTLIEGGTLADSEKLKGFREQLAFVIGAKDEFERARLLRTFLRTIPTKATAIGGQIERGPAMGEYETARKELEAVLTVIAQKRTALMPTLPTQPKKSRVIKPEVIWASKKLDGKAVSQEMRTQNKEEGDFPEFVVVIERGYQP